LSDAALQAGAKVAGQWESFAGIMREISVERAMQDGQWGGPAHDDRHSPVDWLDLVNQQIDKASLAAGAGAITPLGEMQLVRLRLSRIAALAVAGMQSIDRLRAKLEGGVG